MKKLHFINVIEKFHLSGLVERVKLSVTDKTLHIKFIAELKNVVGEITAPGIELEDCEIGIYSTSQLLKLVSITESFITLNVEKARNISTKLLIDDTQFSLEYILSDTMLTPNIPNIDEPDYDIEADIDKDFLNKFIKAKKALDTEVFLVNSTKDNKINFILGGGGNYSNKITLTAEASKFPTVTQSTKFPLIEFKEILENNKDMSSCKLFVSGQGLLKITFETEDKIKATYTVVGKE